MKACMLIFFYRLTPTLVPFVETTVCTLEGRGVNIKHALAPHIQVWLGSIDLVIWWYRLECFDSLTSISAIYVVYR